MSESKKPYAATLKYLEDEENLLARAAKAKGRTRPNFIKHHSLEAAREVIRKENLKSQPTATDAVLST